MAWNGWSGSGVTGFGIQMRRPSRMLETRFMRILPWASSSCVAWTSGLVPWVPIFQMSCDLRNRCFLNISLTIAVALRVQSVCGEGVAMVEGGGEGELAGNSGVGRERRRALGERHALRKPVGVVCRLQPPRELRRWDDKGEKG